MALMSLQEFDDHIRDVLVAHGDISSNTPMHSILNELYDYPERYYDIFTDSTRYDLIVVHNKINNKRACFLEVRAGLYGSDQPVECEYKLETSTSAYGYVSLMYRYTNLNGATTMGYWWRTEGHNEGFGTTNTLMCYLPVFDSGEEFFGSYFMNHGTSINDNWQYVAQMYGGSWQVNMSSAGDQGGFYVDMTRAQREDVDSYEIMIVEQNHDVQEIIPVDEYTQLELWRNFSKREKSTKRPAIQGELLNVVLLEDTDVLSPSFVLKKTHFDYNYCKWGGRYYYCKVTNLNTSQIRIDCTYDPLATWKDAITASNAYIDRAAWSGQRHLIDDTNPPTDEVIIKHATSGYPICATDAGNYWITTTSINGLQLFQLTSAQFKTFCDALWAVDANNESVNTPEQIKLVMENIISVKRVPFTATGDSHNFDVGNFYLTAPQGGSVPTPVSCTKIDFTVPANINAGSITIPFASADYGYSAETYLDHAPYCTALIYLPFVGLVPLDLDAFGTVRAVTVKAQIDRMACGIVYKIMNAADGQTLATYNGNFGTSVPVSSNTYDQRGFISSELTMIGGAAAMVGGLASGNLKLAAGGLGAIAGGSMQLQKSAELHTQICGGMSSNLGFYVWDGYVHVITVNKKPVSTNLDANKAIYGLPTKKVNSLNGSGYVKTIGAQIEMAGNDEEKRLVNSLLDSGIYIE